MKEVIIKKLVAIRKVLRNPEGDYPEITLSIGIAFSTEGMTEELYQKADKALYYVKEHGRNGYKFYDEM